MSEIMTATKYQDAAARTLIDEVPFEIECHRLQEPSR